MLKYRSCIISSASILSIAGKILHDLIKENFPAASFTYILSGKRHRTEPKLQERIVHGKRNVSAMIEFMSNFGSHELHLRCSVKIAFCLYVCYFFVFFFLACQPTDRCFGVWYLYINRGAASRDYIYYYYFSCFVDLPPHHKVRY